MAQVISQEFLDVWERKSGKIASIQVQYKRRFFDNLSPGSFVYEDDFTILSQSEFKDAGEIINNLDTPFLNIFKTSAVTLRLNNSDNQWIPTVNSPSIFQADSIATSGYDPFLTTFRVRFGYQKTDGTIEYLTIFTGVATNYNFDGLSADVEVTVESNARLLKAADASRVSDVFTQEAAIPATGDGSNKDFTTTSEGVGRISQVRVDGVVQVQGTDYTISELNEAGTKAKITFTTAPPNTETVDSTGIKWKANEKIETLIGLLCDEAGILSIDRIINPVIFPGGLSASKTIDTQIEWEDGTVFTFIDTTTIPGSIKSDAQLIDDFSNGNFTSPRLWTVDAGSWTVISNRLRSTAASILTLNEISTPFTQTEGFWEFTHNYFNNAQTNAIPARGGNLGGFIFRFMINSSGDQYALFGGPTSSSANPSHSFILTKFVSSVTTTLLSFTLGGGVYTANTDRVWRIERTAAGVMEVFLDDVSKGSTAADTSITSSIKIACLGDSQSGGGFPSGNIFDDIKYSPNQTAIYESEEFDLLSTPTAFGKLDRTETLNGGTIKYFTRVASSSGGPFDAYIEISGDGQINSALKQFLQIKVEIDPASGSTISPEVAKLVANFTTVTANVALANFSGQTCLAAVEQLVRIPDYEMLFNGAGTFIVRSKTVTGSAVLAINQENAISRMTNYNSGFAFIFNVGQVQYGEYFNEFDGDDAGEAAPTSEARFGRLIKFEDYSNFLLANDANLGISRARIIYENNFAPRRRCRLLCKIIPWLELSDIITITYLDNPLFQDSIFGDPLQLFGFGGFGPPANVLARDLNFKIVGIEFIPTEAECELTLQEVL